MRKKRPVQVQENRLINQQDLSPWLSLVEKRELRVGIIGLGYVGLPLVLLFSQQGFRVIGFDIDASKVDRLNAGESYIHRIDAQQIKDAQKSGFRATANFAEIGQVDAILICVPTPLSDHHTPDMNYIAATMDSIVGFLRPGQLIVLESTTYPGTTEELIAPAIERGGRVKVMREALTSDGVLVAYSPEREDPGNTSIDRRDIPKVVGGLGHFAAEAAAALYSAAFHRVIRVSSPAAAEMTKLLENIYRCVNIALVNELKLLCLRMGIDIWEVIAAAATKPFGFQPFYPGPGLGGHCIPIDPFYLSWKAKEFDFSTRFIELAGEVNEAMPYHVVAAVSSALNQRSKPLKGSRILVLGLAYKRDVDDLRESPSLSIIEMLRQEGADVSYNDPYFPSVGRGRKYNLNMESQPLENLGGYDCVLIVTDHTSYDYARIVEEAPLVVDSRNATQGLRSEKIVRC
jgi:UDP-N-acetyl-D-glucosamine dehydrogenase